MRSCGTARVCISFLPRLQEVRSIDKTRNQFDLTPHDLAAYERIVGADLCFWEVLVDPLYQRVRHGVAAGVADILVADPGRPPFDALCARCVQHGNTEVCAWAMTTPLVESGRMLRVVGDASLAACRPPYGSPQRHRGQSSSLTILTLLYGKRHAAGPQRGKEGW